MKRLVIATTATSAPMGAQKYEAEIRSRAAHFLTGDGWSVDALVARSLRSSLPGDRRLPMGHLFRATVAERRTLGRLVYPRKAVVHRMDLVLPPPPGPDVVTLHDVVSWKFTDESVPVKAASQELLKADAVICVSRFTAQEAEGLLGLKNPVVIPNGVDKAYFDARPLDEAALDALGLRPPFVLYAGGSAARKNLPSLAEAWRRVSQSRPGWQLALSGPSSPARTQLFARSPRTVHLGRVADSMMPALVSSAAVVVVPSIYEGFGLPALEAMAAGTPLLSSNRSSLPEVVGDTATLVDPTPDALAQGLEHVTSGAPELAHLATLARLRAEEFTWDRSADAHARVWRAVS